VQGRVHREKEFCLLLRLPTAYCLPPTYCYDVACATLLLAATYYSAPCCCLLLYLSVLPIALFCLLLPAYCLPTCCLCYPAPGCYLLYSLLLPATLLERTSHCTVLPAASCLC